MVGLRTRTSQAVIARAAFEGVACGLLDGLDALTAATGVSPQRIVMVGGGARSATYRRVVADLSGLPVVVPHHPEQVATGACVQAVAVLTGRAIDDIQAAWDLTADAVTAPDPTVDRWSIRHRYRQAQVHQQA